MAKSADEIKNEIISQIVSNFPTAEVGTGSMIRDLMVDPQSVQLANVYTEIDNVNYNNTFVKNASLLTTEELDNIGLNYGVVRDAAKLSTGSITFRASSLPTQRIMIGNSDGNGGVSIKTLNLSDGSVYEYVTTETVYMETDAFYNSISGFYEVSASISSTLAGSTYNVGIGTIVVLITGISGIDGAYNYLPTTGGTDSQSNIDFANKIVNVVTGASKNVIDGIDNILLSLSNVSEVKTLHPNSESEPTETGYAFSYIKTLSKTNVVETFNFVSTTLSYNFSNKPVDSITSVSAYVNGVLTTLVQNTDYYLDKDESTRNSNSIYASDRITFLYSGTTPDPNTTFTVNYVYNSVVKSGQDLINNEAQDILILGNIIVKASKPILIDIETKIKLKYGYNTTTIQNTVLSGISSYILSLSLGAELTQNELFSYLMTTFPDYISSIEFPFIIFKKRLSSNTVSDELYFTYGEYANLDESSLSITFS